MFEMFFVVKRQIVSRWYETDKKLYRVHQRGLKGRTFVKNFAKAGDPRGIYKHKYSLIKYKSTCKCIINYFRNPFQKHNCLVFSDKTTNILHDLLFELLWWRQTGKLWFRNISKKTQMQTNSISICPVLKLFSDLAFERLTKTNEKVPSPKFHKLTKT